MFMDPIFIGIYVVELAIKMYALRLYFFKDAWNWFGRSTLASCLIYAPKWASAANFVNS